MEKRRKLFSMQMILFEFRNTTGNPYVHIFGIGMPILMMVVISRAVISEMTDGQKKSLAYRAQVLIGEGKIDSIKAISVLERTLNVDLIEH